VIQHAEAVDFPIAPADIATLKSDWDVGRAEIKIGKRGDQAGERVAMFDNPDSSVLNLFRNRINFEASIAAAKRSFKARIIAKGFTVNPFP
jgi:hypothetical protein